jgi:hypothetical protein
MEIVTTLQEGVWRQAATEYYEQKTKAVRSGKVGPQGVQSFLNKIIDERMEEFDWKGSQGRFRKDDAWVRITFRHQMSLEADMLDALVENKRQGATQTAIIAATNDFLKLISPNDWRALCSAEKLTSACQRLEGCLDFPIFIGRLEPFSDLPKEVDALVSAPRPRGRTVPARDGHRSEI